MRYNNNAPAIAYAAPGTKLSVLGAVLLLIAGCLLGIGHLIIKLFLPIATEPSGVLTVHGYYIAVAIALGTIGGIAVIVGIAINFKLPASKKLRARARRDIRPAIRQPLASSRWGGYPPRGMQGNRGGKIRDLNLHPVFHR